MATDTYNVHYNLSAWASGSYVAGNRVYVGSVSAANAYPLPVSGNVYQCTTSGTSTGAPTGTGSNINNGGTAVWKWLSTYDFNTAQNADNYLAFISNPIPNPTVIQFWNNGIIQETITGGDPWLFLNSSIGATATNTLTITAAPGESFVDTLGSGTKTGALTPSASNGVLINFANVSGGTNLFWVVSPYVIVSRLQFVDPNATSGSRIFVVDTGSNNVTVTQCIFDFYRQSVDAMTWNSASGLFTNNLLIDRSTGSGGGTVMAISSPTTIRIANCSLLAISSPTGGYSIYNENISATGAINIENCLLMGYTNGINGNSLGSTVATYCVTDITSPGGSGLAAGTGNLYSKTQANQYISTSNFRLKGGADCINAGTTDTTDIPGAIDIVGTSRPQGSAWDVGAAEFISNYPAGLSDSAASSESLLISAASLAVSDSAAASESYSVGPRVISASLSDTAASSDSFVAASPSYSLSDTAASSDSLSATKAAVFPLSDSAASSETYTPSIGTTGVLSDTAASSDIFTFNAKLTLTDSAVSSESLTGAGAASGSSTASAVSSESLTGAGAATAALTDTAASSDALTVKGYGWTLSDSAASSDTLTETFSAPLSLSDSAAASDSYVLPGTGRVLADTAAASETLGFVSGYSFSLADSTLSSETLTGAGVAAGSLTDSVASSDSRAGTEALTSSLSESAAVSDQLAVSGYGFVLADFAANSDGLSATASNAITDAAASSDAITFVLGFVATWTTSAASSDSITAPAESFSGAVIETAATSDSVGSVLHSSLSLPAESAVSGDEFNIVTYLGSFTDTATTADSLSAQNAAASALLVDISVGSDNIIFISAGITISDTVLISDQTTGALSSSGNYADIAFSQDTFAFFRGYKSALSDDADVSDTAVLNNFGYSSVLADSVTSDSTFVSHGISASLHVLASVVPTGGAVLFQFPSYFPLPAKNITLTIRRSVAGSNNWVTIYQGPPLGAFVDAGDGLPVSLSGSTGYLWQMIDDSGVTEVGPLTPKSTLINEPDQFTQILMRGLQGALNGMILPPGTKPVQIMTRMPQNGWTAMPFIVVNLDLIQQTQTEIGEDVENPSQQNIWTLFSNATRLCRVTVMSQDAEERDFYRDALLTVFRVLKATAFQPLGWDISHSFEAASYSSAQEWDGHVPGFYGADLLLEINGVFPAAVMTEYPVILEITPDPVYEPNEIEVLV